MALDPGAFFKRLRAKYMRDHGIKGLKDCCDSAIATNTSQRCCEAFKRNEPTIPPKTKDQDIDQVANGTTGWDDQILMPAETFKEALTTRSSCQQRHSRK